MCVSAWNEKAGDGEVYSTYPHSRTVHFVTCLSALVEFLWPVRQLSLAHRRLAFSLCFPLIKRSFCLLNYTDLDHSKSLLVGCLYQILAGISLATLCASPTVLHETCNVFESSPDWCRKSWGKNMRARDHFKVAILRILLELWLAGCRESNWYFIQLDLTLIIWNASFFHLSVIYNHRCIAARNVNRKEM